MKLTIFSVFEKSHNHLGHPSPYLIFQLTDDELKVNPRKLIIISSMDFYDSGLDSY